MSVDWIGCHLYPTIEPHAGHGGGSFGKEFTAAIDRLMHLCERLDG